MNGIISINKPKGMTSREAVDQVSRAMHARGTRRRDRVKLGHAGTLDPLASGVLLVCIGSATRLVPLLQEQPKVYQAEFRFGETSETDDLEGTVIPHDVSLPEAAAIQGRLPEFLGTIEQRPPDYSAVHVAGGRAYQLARRQVQVDIDPRPVEVYRFEMLSYSPPAARFEIECASGTYIRSLARDLGERLESGALMSDLIRKSSGAFRIEDSLQVFSNVSPSREAILGAFAPLTEAVPHLPTLTVTEGETDVILRGNRLPWSREQAKRLTPPRVSVPATLDRSDGRVAIVQQGGDLIAIAELQRNHLQPRLVLAK